MAGGMVAHAGFTVPAVDSGPQPWYPGPELGTLALESQCTSVIVHAHAVGVSWRSWQRREPTALHTVAYRASLAHIPTYQRRRPC